LFKIAIANEKGGVAKTTSAVSLAACLAEIGKKVLLFDLDAQANSTLALGLDPSNSHLTVFDVLFRTIEISNAAQKTSAPGISMIPATQEVGLIEKELSRLNNYETRLQNILQLNSIPYDFAIFDCPPFLGAVTLNAITASNLLVIPTQAEYFSIYALRNLMNLIRKVRLSNNPRLTYRLLITLFDQRNRIHRLLYQHLQTNFSMGLFQTIIAIDTRLRECPVSGKTIIQHAPRSRAAKQYRALTQEILDIINSYES
jgi:chromosome partitioning protein